MQIAIPILTFSKAGGHRVICKLANAWVEAGHNVEIILCYDSKSYFPFDKRVNITLLHGKSTLDNVRKITKYIRENFDNYDAIIGNQNRTAFYIFWGGLFKRNYKKCFYYIQAYEPEFFRFGFKEGLNNYFKIHAWFSYFLPLVRIVNSKNYYHYKNLRSNKVVYPGLDLELYHPKDLSHFNETIRIGTIGRVEEWKGTADVCKAMEILRADGVNFEFYLAFNDFDTIPHHFVKPDGDENLSAFYRDMDIVVAACKGQHGAIHYPVIETMAVGTSIVCTDYYPSNNTNAYKVDESSPSQISEAIKRIINNRNEAICKRKQALKDVQQFDWPIVAQKFMDYLKEGRDNL